MLAAVKGKYKDGKIELAENPGVLGEAAVVVTFLDNPAKPDARSSGMMTFGMLSIPGRRMSTLDDFKDSEHDDSRWDRV